MAVADAERARKSRERMKEKLGEEGLKQYEHEKYLKKRERARLKRELEKAMSFPERMKLYILFRDLKKALRPQYSEPDGSLLLAKKKKLDVACCDLIRTIINHGIGDFSILGEDFFKRKNLFPEFDTKYFQEISDKLTGDEAEIWEYFYFQLYYAEFLQYYDVDVLFADFGIITGQSVEMLQRAISHLGLLKAIEMCFDHVEMLAYRGAVSVMKRGSGWAARDKEFPVRPLSAILKLERRTLHTKILPDGKRVTTSVHDYR